MNTEQGTFRKRFDVVASSRARRDKESVRNVEETIATCVRMCALKRRKEKLETYDRDSASLEEMGCE